ncbi:MAG: DUF349 domain-containing protein [Alteromonadaceae bacterium]|nr:DUF349 domain-containing protein [Alteromonadaceae bacterium]
MAAFIQKLFRTRKATPVKNPGQPAKEQAPPESPSNTREQRVKEQADQLAGNPDQALLARLAIEGATAGIRLQAAQQISDETCLQQIQKQARGRDKNVYQSVKQSLQAIREQEQAEQANREKITDLIRQASELSVTEDTKLYQPRLESLLEQWKPLEKQASAEQSQQFLEAVYRCRERLSALQEAQKEAEWHEEQARQRAETLALLEQTLTDLSTGNPTAQPSTSALDALQKTQENRWLEATRDTQVSKPEQKQYEQHMQALRHYLNATRRLEQAREPMTALLETDQPNPQAAASARQLLSDIDWPSGFALPDELNSLNTLAQTPEARKTAPDDESASRNREQQRTLAAALKSTLSDLEAALEAKQYKESKQRLKAAQQQFQQLDSRHKKEVQARLQLLNGQFRELSDWQGFATEPKQIALCEQMEYLADQPMEPEAKAERIKELQNEWRELGGSSDRALWTRFKNASDQAYEPCKEYFRAKSGLKQANLEKREAICQQLTTFLDNVDWASVDWKNAERIHQTARQEWKSAWPVDFRQNRPLQKRFDALLKQLEAPLNEERKKNEAFKQTIVERAEALIEHQPLEEAMEQAKALQAEWQAVGITRHREDRKLWKAFRKACDAIFARRENERASRQEQQEQAEQQAKARREQKQRDQILHWQALVADSTAGLPDHWPSLAAEAGEQPARDLLIRLEILTGTDSPEADQARRMEIQVQRLTEGLGSEETTNAMQAAEQLVAAWCIKTASEEPTAEQAERLKRSLENLLPAN